MVRRERDEFLTGSSPPDRGYLRRHDRTRQVVIDTADPRQLTVYVVAFSV